jgi:hypothetical protein
LVDALNNDRELRACGIELPSKPCFRANVTGNILPFRRSSGSPEGNLLSHVASVTGGATGLGHSVGLQLCARGALVVAAEKNAPASQALADEGRDDLGALFEEPTARIPVGRRASCGELARLALDAPAYIGAEQLNLSGCLDKD